MHSLVFPILKKFIQLIIKFNLRIYFEDLFKQA
jgi:hypothetical protein